MERLTYFECGKWRLKIGDTEYSGEAVDRLAAYEDTRLEPEEIISAMDMAKIACALHELNAYKELGPIDRLRTLKQADDEGGAWCCLQSQIKLSINGAKVMIARA